MSLDGLLKKNAQIQKIHEKDKDPKEEKYLAAYKRWLDSELSWNFCVDGASIAYEQALRELKGIEIPVNFSDCIPYDHRHTGKFLSAAFNLSDQKILMIHSPGRSVGYNQGPGKIILNYAEDTFFDHFEFSGIFERDKPSLKKLENVFLHNLSNVFDFGAIAKESIFINDGHVKQAVSSIQEYNLIINRGDLRDFDIGSYRWSKKDDGISLLCRGEFSPCIIINTGNLGYAELYRNNDSKAICVNLGNRRYLFDRELIQKGNTNGFILDLQDLKQLHSFWDSERNILAHIDSIVRETDVNALHSLCEPLLHKGELKKYCKAFEKILQRSIKGMF